MLNYFEICVNIVLTLQQWKKCMTQKRIPFNDSFLATNHKSIIDKGLSNFYYTILWDKKYQQNM